MAYSEQLGGRVRAILGAHPSLVEKKMFGGLAFLLDGHMCCGIVGEDLMVRVGPEAADEALAQPHARPMDFTGRPMKGMVYVAAEGVATARQLKAWVGRGVAFASTLPPKDAGRKKKTAATRR
ncbi:MAG: TfoX/Sxy family protein [Bryobacteraceae bacterium]